MSEAESFDSVRSFHLSRQVFFNFILVLFCKIVVGRRGGGGKVETWQVSQWPIWMKVNFALWQHTSTYLNTHTGEMLIMTQLKTHTGEKPMMTNLDESKLCHLATYTWPWFSIVTFLTFLGLLWNKYFVWIVWWWIIMHSLRPTFVVHNVENMMIHCGAFT